MISERPLVPHDITLALAAIIPIGASAKTPARNSQFLGFFCLFFIVNLSILFFLHFLKNVVLSHYDNRNIYIFRNKKQSIIR